MKSLLVVLLVLGLGSFVAGDNCSNGVCRTAPIVQPQAQVTTQLAPAFQTTSVLPLQVQIPLAITTGGVSAVTTLVHTSRPP